jgi:penicillin-binding protein 1C
VTTLDLRTQAAVLEVLSRQIGELAKRGVQDAAALVVDNATGDVLAYAGNQGSGASAPFVDGVKAPRQAGSTLKPFLYAQVLEERLLTAASLLDDSPADLVTPSGLYVPQNYDRDFRGPVSVRAALSGSLNVPAVRTLMLLGPERFTDRLRDLGFEHVVPSGDFYGYSLALGSADVTLKELVNAYRTFANGGAWSPLRVLPAPPGKRRACRTDRAPPGSLPTSSRTAVRAVRASGWRIRWRRLSGRGEDGHEQGHARQLVHRVLAAVHGGRVGR